MCLAAGLPSLLLAAGLEPVVTAPATTWSGQQYVGADAKGRVFVLRPKDNLVYPLRDGELGEPRKLKAGPMSSPVPVLDAAMDLAGDWVALFGGEVRWYRSGKEVNVPRPPWSVAAVTLLDGRPVVAVYPNPVGRLSDRELRTVPLLMTLSGDRWSVLVESDREGPTQRDERAEARITDGVHLLTDSSDTLWVASRYRYRLAQYSAAGRELLTLEVDGARVHYRDELEMEETRVAFEKERARHADPESVRIGVNTAVPAILDLTEGPDGSIYLLTAGAADAGEGKAAPWSLDRFNPLTGTLERTPLAFHYPGALSLAAGKDGLYVVRFNGEKERAMIPWEAIEAAKWTAVEGVEVDGWEVEVSLGEIIVH